MKLSDLDLTPGTWGQVVFLLKLRIIPLDFHLCEKLQIANHHGIEAESL